MASAGTLPAQGEERRCLKQHHHNRMIRLPPPMRNAHSNFTKRRRRFYCAHRIRASSGCDRQPWLRSCSSFSSRFRLLNIAGASPDYKLNILGKYLCFAIVALGIDLIWGYTGLLSLCQALFFALGAYAMAMHLSLPEGGGQYDYPQFMTFAYYGHGKDLPWFWVPFRHLPVRVIRRDHGAGNRGGAFRVLHPPKPRSWRLFLNRNPGACRRRMAADQPK